MAKETHDFTKQFTNKFFEFRLLGLEQYQKYLEQQLKLSKGKDNMEAYRKYIEKENKRNLKLMESVKAKIQ